MTLKKKLILTVLFIICANSLRLLAYTRILFIFLIRPEIVPVFLCGMICGAPFGVICGLSLLPSYYLHFITAYHPLTLSAALILYIVLFYPAYNGLIAGLAMKLFRTGSILLNAFLSLTVSNILGEAVRVLHFSLSLNADFWVNLEVIIAINTSIMVMIETVIIYFVVLGRGCGQKPGPKVQGEENVFL